MDVRYINPFLTGAMNVLKTMAYVDLKPGKPFLKKDQVAKGDVSGIIGLTGAASGSLSVTFNFKLVQQIMSNMLGEEVSELNDEVRDAVGEITNMISGDARRMHQLDRMNEGYAVLSHAAFVQGIHPVEAFLFDDQIETGLVS